MAQALEGIRVLDMTIFQQGTYPGAMFADLGADVIKIEGPDSPDPGRFVSPNTSAPGGYTAYFQTLNRGKRAICIDLKQESGRAILHKLAETADVFVSNMRRPALRKLGADYATLRQINPRIIYGRASAYGPKGPDADLGGMDILGQARGGIMSVTGDPSGPPRQAGAAIGDHVGAITMAFGLMTALFYRERTGVGQEVDASLLGGQMCIQSHGITGTWWTGNQPPRRFRGPNPTWNAYRASDGKWFALGMNQQPYWPGTCKVIGRPEWLTDERYATLDVRVRDCERIYNELQEIFLTKTRDEWVRLFSEQDLMASPVNDYNDLATDPQVVANNYLARVPTEDGETLPMVGMPVVFGETPGGPQRMAPEFSQHTEEVLIEAGYTWDDLTALREAGVIGPRAKVTA